jgi:hypothetical protein
MVKSGGVQQLKFIDTSSGLVTKDIGRLGKKIDYCFPLLDPSLNFD